MEFPAERQEPAESRSVGRRRQAEVAAGAGRRVATAGPKKLVQVHPIWWTLSTRSRIGIFLIPSHEG